MKCINFYCGEVSAIAIDRLEPLKGFNTKMQQIDLTAQYTLRNCMQKVFEDGPKRDHRLWLGDFKTFLEKHDCKYKPNLNYHNFKLRQIL